MRTLHMILLISFLVLMVGVPGCGNRDLTRSYEEKAPIDYPDSNGLSVLHRLFLRGMSLPDLGETTDKEILRGADVNARDKADQTPLHYLMEYSLEHKEIVEVVRKLISSGASPCALDKKHMTPLDYMVQKESVKDAKEIIRAFSSSRYGLGCIPAENYVNLIRSTSDLSVVRLLVSQEGISLGYTELFHLIENEIYDKKNKAKADCLVDLLNSKYGLDLDSNYKCRKCGGDGREDSLIVSRAIPHRSERVNIGHHWIPTPRGGYYTPDNWETRSSGGGTYEERIKGSKSCKYCRGTGYAVDPGPYSLPSEKGAGFGKIMVKVLVIAAMGGVLALVLGPIF